MWIILERANINVVKWINERKATGAFNLATVNWPDLLHIEQLDIDDKEPIRVQQEAFLQAVADRALTPEVSAAEGLAALRCAAEILAAVKKHKWGSELGDGSKQPGADRKSLYPVAQDP